MTAVDEKFEFQIGDWNSYHEIDDNEEEKYVMQLFGRTSDDKDVCLKVTGYTPFFYVEVPLNWNKKHVDRFVDKLKDKVKWCTNNNPNYNYDLSKSLTKYKLVQKHKFYNFTNKKLFKFVMLIFKSHTAMREFSNILARPLKASGLTPTPMLYQRYESNIEPHLRFMHIKNLSSCGWVSLDPNKMKKNNEYSYCDHSYSIDWTDVMPSTNDERVAPFKIMGYDIECTSCDHNFPQADRKTDQIIQIGMTMYRYGSMKCYEQHLLTLKKCNKIKKTNVECYKTEKGLIRGWAKKMTEIRPDFKAGYNNFGFDDKYIFDRIARIDKETADKQGISVDSLQNKFIDEILEIIGKVNNRYLMDNEGLRKSLTYFEVKNLSSSALGDNELKFIQVPGMLSIDMMKIIQRDHRLVGYKLDNVSANFITEGTNKIVEGEEDEDGLVSVSIYTRSTQALEIDSYVQIMVNDGYSSSSLVEGAKYHVSDIETITETRINEEEKKQESYTFQAIKTKMPKKDIADLREALTNPVLKVFWTFAKDDMHHTLINKYFVKGDPKNIAKVGKYCLKDCKLVNLLLNKLDIINNSIGMAKVCHVPLSYLFLRGQGVKIFSLVSKKCREKNYLIPVIRKKKKDNDGDEDETYEGATVITPKPGVYLSPIGVLDFNALYPNSMRERNLSQECYINDPLYDNLPGYIYHDVFITLKDRKGKILRNSDGTPQKEHHRFAQEILTEETIREELKDFLDKLDVKLESDIKSINNSKSFTKEYLEDKISIEKSKLDAQIKKLESNETKSKKKIAKLVSKAKNEHSDSTGIYIRLLENVKEAEANFNKILAEIKSKKSDNLNKSIHKEKNKHEKILKELFERLKFTAADKKDLIEFTKARSNKKFEDEKGKKFNTVDGVWVRYGILPEILTELLNKRKETNGRLAQEADPFIRSILNSLQLAFKVTANSLYGQTGAPTSPIFFIQIAASTTAIGRERLHHAKKVVEENFPGSEVIYGDSVTADTPIIHLDSKGGLNIKEISKLGKEWQSYEGFKAGQSNRKDKQQAKSDSYVWTSNGWSKIKRIIRHKTSKKIYRVTTNTGSIDVTEDHSLLNEQKQIIKPTECKVGTKLLHGFMETAQVAELKDLFQTYIKNSDKCFETKDKMTAQITYYILKSLNYHVKLSSSKNKFYVRYSDTKFKSDPNSIISIEELESTNIDGDYVYDLETEDGTFHAGIGEMIVKNTDSIFINFHIKDENGNERTDREALIQTIDLCQKAASLINRSIPKPQFIVYEKTFFPFILVAKKKYVGYLFEKNPDKYSMKSMGIVLKRRDNAPIVKIVVGGIIDCILKYRSIDKAVEYTKDILRKLMDGKYPIDKFIISKTLKARYKKPKTIAHKVLADRMGDRDPGNKPQINDRIPFVYVVKDMGKKKKKDILQGDLIEHPEFVVKNGLKIDYLYYLEHQIINPATQVLELMMPTRKVEKMFNLFIIEEDNKRKGRQSMEKWIDSSKIKTIVIGSKTAKTNKLSAKEEKYKKLPYIGNTRRLEKQSMAKWMDTSSIKVSSSDDWMDFELE